MSSDEVTESQEKHVSKKEHYSFKEIKDYIVSNKYPDGIKDKGEKANFRRATKAFSTFEGKLMYIRKLKDGSSKQVRTSFLNPFSES